MQQLNKIVPQMTVCKRHVTYVCKRHVTVDSADSTTSRGAFSVRFNMAAPTESVTIHHVVRDILYGRRHIVSRGRCVGSDIWAQIKQLPTYLQNMCLAQFIYEDLSFELIFYVNAELTFRRKKCL
jgi:hypothetical protein